MHFFLNVYGMCDMCDSAVDIFLRRKSFILYKHKHKLNSNFLWAGFFSRTKKINIKRCIKIPNIFTWIFRARGIFQG